MSLTEVVNQNKGHAEAVLKGVPAVVKSIRTEQLPTIGRVIQQDSHEIGLEQDSKTTLRDVVISTLVLLSFAAILAFVYLVLPS